MPLPLDTPRLQLTPLRPEDDQEMMALYTEDALRYIEPGRPPEKILAMFQRLRDQFAQLGFGYLAARKHGQAEIIGGGLLIVREPGGPTELGYLLGREHAGQGYTTELAARMVRWAFEELGQERLVAQIHPENLASRAVLQKLGFHLDKPAAGTRSEWYALDKSVDSGLAASRKP